MVKDQTVSMVTILQRRFLMGTVRQVLVGVISVAFLVTGVTMVTPFASEADGFCRKQCF